MKSESRLEIINRKIILASKSQRRIKLLSLLPFNFISVDSKVKETEPKHYNPIRIVKMNAALKCRTVAKNYKDAIVIGADTIVYINKEILHKPKDNKEAFKFLKKLSGRKHLVYTGIHLIDTATEKEITDYEKTIVYFRKLNYSELKFYISNYKPLDKAGGYGIQDDFGCIFIEKIIGDFYNVVGLPLTKLYLSVLKLCDLNNV